MERATTLASRLNVHSIHNSFVPVYEYTRKLRCYAHASLVCSQISFDRGRNVGPKKRKFDSRANIRKIRHIRRAALKPVGLLVVYGAEEPVELSK